LPPSSASASALCIASSQRSGTSING
jgi:hypothetical protein